ncbi:spore germination protein GerPC [Thermoactinomyces sp. DSM 45892]|uniref:spore germination protein GerPC n=1 Tax=Thermoactinomyces sp. DSM 45892 TaxID=1882753 RepID=UPI000899D552|nr:spore germination protein GerPC [Thermoactinomyces sp. DSM 45892]SDZ27423.1 Spore germination protein GerPC [Thermoactinomyces sp. DSM 45892]
MTWEEMYTRIQRLEQEVHSLRRDNCLLQEQVSQIKPIAIEHITYKVQELHVETLSGTLNVGLASQAMVEDVNGFVDEITEKFGTNLEIHPKRNSTQEKPPTKDKKAD